MRACSFLLPTELVPGTFFNASYQVNAVAIAIVETNPLIKTFLVFLFSALYIYRTCVTTNYVTQGIHP